jgi:FKBP-type peptidyl-prolyl cis-trans isomerase
MNNIRILMAVPAVLISLSVSAETTLTTDKDKFSYSLGLMIGERVLKQYGEVDYQILLEGIIAQHQGKDALMDLTEAERILGELQQKMNEQKFSETKSKGEAFLEANAKRDGVTVTASGLQYSVMTAADGAKPAATDSVTVHYRGTLLDGTEFDSSYSRNEPATFALNQVIRGWTEGVQLMNVGSKFKFAIPYQLAYGERGAGNSIGPFETLVFEVELLKINN